MSAARLSDLVVSPPKRSVDGTLFAQARRRQGERKKRLLIKLVASGCMLKKNAQTLVLTATAPEADVIGAVEDALVDAVRANCGSWFGEGVEATLAEEYFVPVLHYDRAACSAVLRARLQQQPAAELLPVLESTEPLDVTLALVGLRFYKQRIVAEWQVQGASPSKAAPQAGLPDSEERAAMAKELTATIDVLRKSLSGMVAALDASAAAMKSEGAAPSLSALEAAREEVEDIRSRVGAAE